MEQTVSELQEQPTVEMNDNEGLSSLKIAGIPVGKIIDTLIQDRDDIQQELENQQQNIDGAFAKLSQLDGHEIETEPKTKTEHESEQGQTPMETILSWSEELAQQELSANEERARFIAKDVTDYATKAPAGFVIDSSTIRKVIKAKTGDRPHTQTVDRIMDFLKDFGRGEVEKTKRRGKNIVSFSEELVKRMNHTRYDRGHAPDRSRSVTS